MSAHLHLDPLGGVAGDMFAAALLDLCPALLEGLRPLLRSVGLADDVTVSLLDHSDGILRGRRFVVDDPRERAGGRKPGAFVFAAGHSLHAHGNHAGYTDICRRLEASDLSPGARTRALDIFARLARAEGSVHGIADVVDVVFHEVGTQDSVADVVTAAVLLERLSELHGGLSASVSSLPLGSGRVQTAHGELPVPAPATLALLHGHQVHDDGRLGERVTPTGAAIVDHLVPAPGPRRPAGRVVGVGTGFGTRTLSGLSNVLRVTLTTTQAAAEPWDREAIVELCCDIDDMTGEELGTGTEQLRQCHGVVDVVALPCLMKKHRLATRLSVLCGLAAHTEVIAEIFRATTTLGVRVVQAERAVLRRGLSEHEGVRVKRAQRPGGDTFKADIDDVVAATLSERRAERRRREDRAAGKD